MHSTVPIKQTLLHWNCWYTAQFSIIPVLCENTTTPVDTFGIAVNCIEKLQLMFVCGFHTSQIHPTGRIVPFCGPVLNPGPYVWHPDLKRRNYLLIDFSISHCLDDKILEILCSAAPIRLFNSFWCYLFLFIPFLMFSDSSIQDAFNKNHICFHLTNLVSSELQTTLFLSNI